MNDSPPQQPPKAIALKWDGQRAPTVVAKGSLDVAERILEIAEHHGIHMHAESGLVDVLMRLELGAEIPRDLYVAVAEVIAFAYSLGNDHEIRTVGRNHDQS